MTVFAGAYALHGDQVVPQHLKDALARITSRADKGVGTRYCSDQSRLYLAKWDSGAFGEPAWQESDDGSICALAGDPILTRQGKRPERQQQLLSLAQTSRALAAEALAASRGSFALVHHVAQSGELRLATDAVGLRTIYYTVQNGLLVFATALRVLESLAQIDKRLSDQGMIELCVFSFPLADRTPYDRIKVLREAEMLVASESGVTLERYRDWASPVNQPTDMGEAAKDIHAEFERGIELRAGSDRHVYGFLSGGMDSRAIIASLVKGGRKVEALNFSFEHSQDLEFARLFVGQIADSCDLHCSPGAAYANYAFLAKAAMRTLESEQKLGVDRPQCIWSGDGGSVGLGHVYMNAQMLDIARTGDVSALVDAFMSFNHQTAPVGILNGEARVRLPKNIVDSVKSEVNRYPVHDLGRRIYFFLLFNDQRRHLFKHFETIDQHGLEVLTPFYDAAFLSKVAATPSQWGILHRLYASFFDLLPAFATRTPWQTYPGHVPCPVSHDTAARYQWTGPLPLRQLALAERAKLSADLLRASRFKQQPPVFSMPRIWLAALAQTLGLRDCRHLLPALRHYKHHSAVAARHSSG